MWLARDSRPMRVNYLCFLIENVAGRGILGSTNLGLFRSRSSYLHCNYQHILWHYNLYTWQIARSFWSDLRRLSIGLEKHKIVANLSFYQRIRFRNFVFFENLMVSGTQLNGIRYQHIWAIHGEKHEEEAKFVRLYLVSFQMFWNSCREQRKAEYTQLVSMTSQVVWMM